MNAKSQDRSPTLFDHLEPPARSDDQDGAISEGPEELPRASVAPPTESVSPFSYDELSEPEAQIARAAVVYIKERGQQATRAGIEIGVKLGEVKVWIGHGRFQRWLRCEFGLSERTARRLMLIARIFGPKLATVAVLPVTTVYDLASVPKPVREELVGSLEAGRRTADQVSEEVREKRRPVVAGTTNQHQEIRSTRTEEAKTEDSGAVVVAPSGEENTEAEALEHFRKVFGDTVANCNELTPALMPPPGLTAEDAKNCTDQIRVAHVNLAALSKRIDALDTMRDKSKDAGSNHPQAAGATS